MFDFLKPKPTGVIRTRIMEKIDQKITEAETQYEEQCKLADDEYRQQLARAATIRQDQKESAEEQAVNSIVNKLL